MAVTPIVANPYGKAQKLTANSNDSNRNAGIGFGDVLDAVNPLQQIPVVSSAYRAATGTSISPISQLMGGALLGGIPGLLSSLVNVAVEAATGQDIAGNVLTGLTPDKSPFQLQQASSLQADEGAALLDNLQAAATQSPTIIAAKQLAENSVPASKSANNFMELKPVETIKRDSLGLEDSDKRKQLLSKLDEVALKM